LSSLRKTVRGITDPTRKRRQRMLERAGLDDKYDASDFSSASEIRKLVRTMKKKKKRRSTRHSSRSSGRKKRKSKKSSKSKKKLLEMIQAMNLTAPAAAPQQPALPPHPNYFPPFLMQPMFPLRPPTPKKKTPTPKKKTPTPKKKTPVPLPVLPPLPPVQDVPLPPAEVKPLPALADIPAEVIQNPSEAFLKFQTTVTDLCVAFGSDKSGKARMENYKDRVAKARELQMDAIAEPGPPEYSKLLKVVIETLNELEGHLVTSQKEFDKTWQELEGRAKTLNELYVKCKNKDSTTDRIMLFHMKELPKLKKNEDKDGYGDRLQEIDELVNQCAASDEAGRLKKLEFDQKRITDVVTKLKGLGAIDANCNKDTYLSQLKPMIKQLEDYDVAKKRSASKVGRDASNGAVLNELLKAAEALYDEVLAQCRSKEWTYSQYLPQAMTKENAVKYAGIAAAGLLALSVANQGVKGTTEMLVKGAWNGTRKVVGTLWSGLGTANGAAANAMDKFRALNPGEAGPAEAPASYLAALAKEKANMDKFRALNPGEAGPAEAPASYLAALAKEKAKAADPEVPASYLAALAKEKAKEAPKTLVQKAKDALTKHVSAPNYQTYVDLWYGKQTLGGLAANAAKDVALGTTQDAVEAYWAKAETDYEKEKENRAPYVQTQADYIREKAQLKQGELKGAAVKKRLEEAAARKMQEVAGHELSRAEAEKMVKEMDANWWWPRQYPPNLVAAVKKYGIKTKNNLEPADPNYMADWV
jgi:hypothetical protein